ncbi:MAG: CDP-alcohol phosphatidyltransferase family protein [Planctomycetota bacterium]|jgi:CDP-diacylglycerol--glycerol-3-phosphate 3-phosphatidyltransferase
MLRLIPNILTFARLVLTIIFLIMILCAPGRYTQGQPSFPGFLDIITDIIDGTIARRLGVTSKFGRMMDPLVDKILVCGAFICFAIIGEPKLFNLSSVSLSIIHWAVVAVLVLREVYVTVLRHIAESRGINFAATMSGKIKMCLQSFAIGTVVVKMAHVRTAAWGHWLTTAVFVIMLAVTIASGIHATRRTSWKQATA